MSRRTGVPVLTLRTFQQSGLIPVPPPYDESYVRRVELVRALMEVGGLTHSDTRRVLGRLESPETSLHQLLGAIQYALPSAGSATDDADWAQAGERVRELAEARQWDVSPDNPAWRTLIQALVVTEWLGQGELIRPLLAYAEALEKVAEAELCLVLRQPDRETAATRMVNGTVIGDTVITALRRLVHEHVSTRLCAAPSPH
ncbi:MerR family transcriptional regulator [Streptomyces uncialis]|uniref:MerR family transcriptional regulator n=1 Tax=Streptomyces uncialis TaxID=1048205 RepID=UPI002E303718|nr:MerR family transcriptional regulator [Streptomyces uncialis]